jgi:hypothetical protein
MGTANWSILVIPLTNISAGVIVIPVLICLIKEVNKYSVWVVTKQRNRVKP